MIFLDATKVIHIFHRVFNTVMSTLNSGKSSRFLFFSSLQNRN